jgi:hypothetical protein
MENNKGTRKTIYFSESEETILNYALSQTSNFASYIKDLIKKDMEKEPFKDQVIKIIEDYLKEKQITVSGNIKEKIDFDNEGLQALNNFMKRG